MTEAPAPNPVGNQTAITPLVLTWNEAPNLPRLLASLSWARQIVVVDSGSGDGTLGLLAADPRVRVLHRDFDNHTDQWNFGLAQVGTPWVLALDADYVLPPSMPEELESLDLDGDRVAWFAGFRYMVHGRPLRGTLYPPRAVLFSKNHCCYAPDGHTQLLQIHGLSGQLKARLDHDDRKPLARWLASQASYARLEADKLLAQPKEALEWPDRLRLWILPAPPLVLLYSLFAKGCVLDGWRGWYYALQRGAAELMLALELLDRRLRS